MKYIEEINRFYEWLEYNQVPKSCISLWHALMHINNKSGWNKKFTVAISVLETKTGFMRSELFKARNILKEKGRINWEQRGGNLCAEYELISHSVRIVDTSGNASGNASGATNDTQTATQTDTINRLHYTTLQQTTQSLPIPTESVEKIKPVKKPVKKKKEETTLYWKKLVDTWFDFYKKNYEVEPTFNGAASKSFKEIIKRMQKISVDGNYEWTEKLAVDCLIHFLNKAKADKWLSNNFLLPNLYSKFDSIVTPKNNGTEKTTDKPATGASVNLESIFTKINGMLD